MLGSPGVSAANSLAGSLTFSIEHSHLSRWMTPFAVSTPGSCLSHCGRWQEQLVALAGQKQIAVGLLVVVARLGLADDHAVADIVERDRHGRLLANEFVRPIKRLLHHQRPLLAELAFADMLEHHITPAAAEGRDGGRSRELRVSDVKQAESSTLSAATTSSGTNLRMIEPSPVIGLRPQAKPPGWDQFTEYCRFRDAGRRRSRRPAATDATGTRSTARRRCRGLPHRRRPCKANSGR